MPDCYRPDDWSRSYLLPDHVSANIPPRGAEGEPGAHNHARGLLVEICHATGAHPISLHYTEPAPADIELTRVTALATLPERARPLQVSTFWRRPVDPQVPEGWSIRIDGVHLIAEDRRCPPSLPWQAGIVTRWLQP